MRIGLIAALLLLNAVRASPAPVDDPVCLSCHQNARTQNPDSPHLKVRSPEEKSLLRCETCYGDGARHVQEGGGVQSIRSFKGHPAADLCMTCHHSKHIADWKSSRHAQVSVDCIDCHAIHRRQRSAPGVQRLPLTGAGGSCWRRGTPLDLLGRRASTVD
jgi:hypothetical protein